MRVKTNDKSISMLLRNKYEKVKNEIHLSATLNIVYFAKKSNQIVNTKINNQLNSMEASMNQINPKFVEKSKNYAKIKEEMIKTLDEYEKVLKRFADIYDEKINQLIFQKAELESKLLMSIIKKEYLYRKEKHQNNIPTIFKGINTIVDQIKAKVNKKEQIDVSLINRVQDQQEIHQELQENMIDADDYKENRKCIIKLEKEIKEFNKKIHDLELEKENKIFAAMEVGGKELVVNIKKPRKIAKIKKFFTNRFNTFNVIMKNIIEPLNQRIDEFKVNELKKVNGEINEFDIIEVQNKLKNIQNEIFEEQKNKVICEELGIIKK